MRGATNTCPPVVTTCGGDGENAGNAGASSVPSASIAASAPVWGAAEQPSAVITSQDHVDAGFTPDVLHRGLRRSPVDKNDALDCRRLPEQPLRSTRRRAGHGRLDLRVYEPRDPADSRVRIVRARARRAAVRPMAPR